MWTKKLSTICEQIEFTKALRTVCLWTAIIWAFVVSIMHIICIFLTPRVRSESNSCKCLRQFQQIWPIFFVMVLLHFKNRKGICIGKRMVQNIFFSQTFFNLITGNILDVQILREKLKNFISTNRVGRSWMRHSLSWLSKRIFMKYSTVFQGILAQNFQVIY